MLTLAGVELAFEHSRRWLKGFLLFAVSEKTIRQETQTLGQEQTTHETRLREQSQDRPGCRSTCARPPRFRPAVWVADAAKVRIDAEFG